MAKATVSVYLTAAQIAAIDRRADAVGKTRSSWISDTLVRALDNELQPYDQVMLDQIVKLRAGQEAFLEALPGSTPAVVKSYRQRAQALGEVMAAQARERIGK